MKANGTALKIYKKLGGFTFYLVKTLHFYLLFLFFCDRSKVHHVFRGHTVYNKI